MLGINYHNHIILNNHSQTTSDKYLRDNTDYLESFFSRHSQEIESNPLLADLKDRVEALNEPSISSEFFAAPDSVIPSSFCGYNFVQKIRYTIPSKRQQITDSILLGDFDAVSNYFYKNPKKIFVYSQLLLTHAELGTLTIDVLLKILFRVASALNQKEHKKKLPSIFETFKDVISIDTQKIYSLDEVNDFLVLFRQDKLAESYPREFTKEMGRCLFLNLISQIAKLDGEVSESIEHQLLIQLQCHCRYYDERKMADCLPFLKEILQKPGGLIVVTSVMMSKDSITEEGVFHYTALSKAYLDVFVEISRKDGGLLILSKCLKEEFQTNNSTVHRGNFVKELEEQCDWFAELMMSEEGKSLCYLFLSNFLETQNSNSFLFKMTKKIGEAAGGFEVLTKCLSNREILKNVKTNHPTLISHLMSLQNPHGKTFGEYIQQKWLNISWLQRIKTLKITPIHTTQYKIKLSQMKADIRRLINGISFGDSADPVLREISTIRYTKSSVDVTVTLSRKDVKNTIDQLFKKLEGSQPWDRISKESQANFSCFILARLLPVIFTLKSRNTPVLTAGVLVTLAKLEIIGRCSSAYPSEIEQLHHLYGNSSKGKTGLSFRDTLKGEVYTYLEVLIEKILKKNNNEVNVHYRNYYLGCVGLYPFKERSTQKLISKSTVLNEIVNNFDLEVLTNQIETNLKDQIRLHVLETMPSDYNVNVLEKINTAKRLEAELRTKLVDNLKNILTVQSLVNKLTKEFYCWRSSCIDIKFKGFPFLELKGHIRSHVREKFLQMVPDESIWSQLSLLFSSPSTEDIEQEVQALIKRIDPILPEDTPNVVFEKLNKMRQVSSIVQGMKSQEALVERFERMISLNKGCELFRDQIWSELVEFTNNIKMIADQLEAQYDFKEYLLPSNALEYQRKEEYLESHPQLGKEIIIKKLLKMGILETFNEPLSKLAF